MASSAREMIDRQQFDHGAPGDDVYRPAKHGVNGDGGKHESRVYHEDEGCFQLTKVGRGVVTESRKEAQQKWLGPCKHCVLDGGEA